MVASLSRRFALAGRGLAAVAVAVLVSGAPLAAQEGPDTWAGTWKGPFVSDGPTGTFTLEIARDGASWKVSNQVEADGAVVPAGEVREWKVEGNAFTFVQAILEFEVVFRGTLEGRELKGTVEGYQGGTLMGTGSFTLSRL